MKKHSIIYHYTTITGFIGIVTNRELWASDCRFLNDGTELSYASDIFFAEVKKLRLMPINDGGYMIPGESLKHFIIFVACFCEEGDLLSQWRGYGVDQSYALGFDTAQLKAMDFGELTPVQYGIKNPTKYFEKELDSATEPTAHPGVAEWHASQWILPRLARVKHPGFAEEHEWRILKQLPSYNFRGEEFKIHFRPSSMGPIAYISIPFLPEYLREIVIGPGANTITREIAIRTMLDIHDMAHVKLRVSKIPYRR